MQKFRCFIHFKLSGYSNIVIPVWILKISSYVPVLHSVHTILWVKNSFRNFFKIQILNFS
ncbi:hypothetical protein ASE55_05435 [Chryseobacterium sp. Leaf201]|nr:hypothetical protein ASE55_05435 [Chryseobacterium sp. Leaf201]